MAVDRNAVREGTRWWFDGEEVVVQEVTPKSVVYARESFELGLVLIDDFVLRASDPANARHERLVKQVHRRIRENLPRADVGLETLAYLLERVGQPAPIYIPPAPRVVPAPVAEPSLTCVAAEPEPVEDYAVTMPVLPDEDEPRVETKRRFR